MPVNKSHSYRSHLEEELIYLSIQKKPSVLFFALLCPSYNGINKCFSIIDAIATHVLTSAIVIFKQSLFLFVSHLAAPSSAYSTDWFKACML